MPAKDLHHDVVKAALIRDGWVITDDPLMLRIGARYVAVDLGAEKLIAAERGAEKIAVEIKSFIGASLISDLQKAWGQFFLYARTLEKRDPQRRLYLAVDRKTFNSLFQEEVGQLLLQEPGFRLLVFDVEMGEIVQWKP